MSNDNGDTTGNGGFVSPTAPDDEIDLAAPEGTPEYERAQEEVMIRGAADASSETEGPLEPGEGDDAADAADEEAEAEADG